MKTMLKYFATMCFVAIMGVAMGQSPQTDRLANAVEELVELKQMDKSVMTKAEKKAWKARKKALRRIIAMEYDRLDSRYARNSWRYSRFGNPYYGVHPGAVYGYPGYFGPRQRVVVVNPRQECVVPAQATQRSSRVRTQQAPVNRTVRTPRTPSSNRRR
ncbi:MAG: hypothetical protein AAF587_12570 [Bacteroidota bacterium]